MIVFVTKHKYLSIKSYKLLFLRFYFIN